MDYGAIYYNEHKNRLSIVKIIDNKVYIENSDNRSGTFPIDHAKLAILKNESILIGYL